VTVLLDDHLLRDWMTTRDDDLSAVIGGEELATTNLWYARLCKSAARGEVGALMGVLPLRQRKTLVAALMQPPVDVMILPMSQLAWRMGELSSEGVGLSTLGAEAVAAAEALEARLVVSERDDAPGVRRRCREAGISYATLSR
jgi:hypothetical protein